MIRNAIQRFMYGRYGNDQLNLFLIGLYLLLYLVFMFTRWDMLYFVSFVLLALTLFRLLSRNMERRRMEHVYFKCPSCGQQLRVPRGRGKITVTCRSCGANFQEKS